MIHGPDKFAQRLGYQSVEDQIQSLEDAVKHLEALSARRLNPAEMTSWIVRLKKYARWKISQLNEYVGPFNDKVLAYLEALQNNPDVKQNPMLMEPMDRTDTRIRLARDVSAHVDHMSKFLGTFTPSKLYLKDKDPEQYGKERQVWLKKKRKVEKAGLLELHRKYPNEGFDQILKEKRFQEETS